MHQEAQHETAPVNEARVATLASALVVRVLIFQIMMCPARRLMRRGHQPLVQNFNSFLSIAVAGLFTKKVTCSLL
jgi:hypothetical protein